MRKVAPIIITIAVLLLMGAYAAVLYMAQSEGPGALRVYLLLLIVFIIGIMIAMIGVLRSRLKEIEEEDKDDLSKY